MFEQQAKPSPAQDTLNQMLNGLESQLPAAGQKRDYRVLSVPSSTVNAIALPGDARSLQSIAASGVAAVSRAQFSQSQEREADKYGYELLTTAP